MLNNRFGLTKKSLMIWSVTLIAALLCISLLVFEGTKATVTFDANGQEKTIRTHADTVEELLAAQDVKFANTDLVEPSKGTKIEDGMEVSWKKGKKVTLTVEGKKETVVTTAETVRDLLHDQAVPMMQRDKVTPSKTTKIKDGMNISVEEAFQIPLAVGGEKKDVWTTSTTVADLLKQQGVSMDNDDRVVPGLQAKVTKETKIKVVRVEKVTDVVEATVDYAVVTRKDSSLTSGKEKVLSEGQEGKVKKHYEVTLENGKEVARKLLKKETTQESKDRIVAVGTKPKPASQPIVSRGGSAVKEMYMKATAYTAYCNGCSGKTRTGIDLRANPGAKVVAVDPNVIPLGTKVWVEGYGYAIAGDTGGAIKGNRIDLFIPDKSKVHAYGVKRVKVKILK
ncbi:ubiquitin-like domain-containing protein [Bacillus tianshenii]|nr:ubiquitin-like domain-containing protein [Bacillus tianshenii]